MLVIKCMSLSTKRQDLSVPGRRRKTVLKCIPWKIGFGWGLVLLSFQLEGSAMLQPSYLSADIFIYCSLYLSARWLCPSSGTWMTKWNNNISLFERSWRISRETWKNLEGWAALSEFIFCFAFLFSDSLPGSPDVSIKRMGCVAQKCQLEPSLGSS